MKKNLSKKGEEWYNIIIKKQNSYCGNVIRKIGLRTENARYLLQRTQGAGIIPKSVPLCMGDGHGGTGGRIDDDPGSAQFQ